MNSIIKFAWVLSSVCISLSASHASERVGVFEYSDVSESEYKFYENQMRVDVGNRLSRETGLPMDDSFWQSEVDGVIAEAILEREILEEITRRKVVEAMAVEKGIVDRVKTFSEWESERIEMNRQRAEWKREGKVFYGPVHFQKDIWFRVRLDQLIRELYKRTYAAMDYHGSRTEGERMARQLVDKEIERRIHEKLSFGK